VDRGGEARGDGVTASALQTLLLAALLALVVAHLGARLAAGSGPMHVPQAGRSSHTVITPSGGGLGVAAGVFAALLAAALLRLELLETQGALKLMGLAALALAVAAVGFFDDLFDWPPRLKFALLGAASAAVALIAGAPQELPGFGAMGLPLGAWAGLLGAALWTFTVMNAVNFMDGADGLAGGAVGIASAGLAVIAALAGAPAAALAAAALAGALLGFLPVNAPNARVFMGDVGSLFSGLWFAGAGLLFVAEAPRGAVYLPPLVLLPILGDVLLTLAWHVRHRIPVLKPHRDHAYQLRIRSGETHASVVRATWLRAALFALLAFAAYRATAGIGDPAWALCGFALGAGVATAWWSLDRRRARARMPPA
jgi:UDP-N-acetylmuramyl pentapeptide phosphotransferase/UDP-N-acetylglucosamine-1-phosphate transferase